MRDGYGYSVVYRLRYSAVDTPNEGSRFGENLLLGSVHFCASDFIARVQVKGPSQGGGVRGEAPQGSKAFVASEQMPMVMSSMLGIRYRHRDQLVTAGGREAWPQQEPSPRRLQ